MWWWPAPNRYWPPDTPRLETVDSFVAAFATLGYSRSANGDFVAGVEKVAIFVDEATIPAHASRQLENGRWTSKLGREIDIEHHSVEGVCGPAYGRVGCFLERPRGSSARLPQTSKEGSLSDDPT